MGSQFVDLNADGHVDYVSATFDGSPHVAYGSKAGFAEPVRLKDANGKRILISYIWDYDKRKHLTDYRSMPSDMQLNERCISALAFDWDADGDYDLLLGSYENGHLYRQMNEGSNAEPAFTGKNIPVLAGNSPLALSAKMTTPKLVDWDGDGDMDLIVGSFGDSYDQNGKSGGVYLSLNVGEKGKPRFAELEPLIKPSQKGGTGPTGPNVGLYPEAVDYDGDGDLDLVVGGYSLWKPKQKKLSAEEKELVAELRASKADVNKRRTAIMQKVNAEVTKATQGLDRSSKEWRAEWTKIYRQHSKEITALGKEFAALNKRLKRYISTPQRQAFVWLYERL